MLLHRRGPQENRQKQRHNLLVLAGGGGVHTLFLDPFSCLNLLPVIQSNKLSELHTLAGVIWPPVPWGCEIFLPKMRTNRVPNSFITIAKMFDVMKHFLHFGNGCEIPLMWPGRIWHWMAKTKMFATERTQSMTFHLTAIKIWHRKGS